MLASSRPCGGMVVLTTPDRSYVCCLSGAARQQQGQCSANAQDWLRQCVCTVPTSPPPPLTPPLYLLVSSIKTTSQRSVECHHPTDAILYLCQLESAKQQQQQHIYWWKQQHKEGILFGKIACKSVHICQNCIQKCVYQENFHIKTLVNFQEDFKNNSYKLS